VGERLSVLSESRVREIRLLGSMKRDVETESWNLDCGTANRKGRQQLRGTYRRRATSRLYDQLRENLPEMKPIRRAPSVKTTPGVREPSVGAYGLVAISQKEA